MFPLNLKNTALAAATLLLLTSKASAGANETNILANCVSPTNSANLSSYEGGSAISVIFPGGDVFSADIPTLITIQGTYVGSAKNNYGTFNCFWENGTAFTAPDGALCNSVYVCSHAPVPSAQIDVQLTFGVNQVVIPGDINVTAMFATINDRKEATACNQNPIAIPGTDEECTIAYSCYGATTWLETNGTASTLISPVSSAVKQILYHDVKTCEYISDRTHQCTSYSIAKEPLSYILETGRINVTNLC
ncbi:hypothetical protein G7Y89_g13084 [Cudoniella acicularis]|uniref:Uncharacterized protein n=1 Tax=Cudoniella acicularis TaxID=354080 RepID=A0A8H4R7X9_9HELO|nr:hypothetical protein G7Y89_g13084 [Cudoniella acicularis]